MAGHGIVGPQTVVIVARDGRRAAVVQADVQRMCEVDNVGAAPICADLRGTLARLARAVLR